MGTITIVYSWLTSHLKIQWLKNNNYYYLFWFVGRLGSAEQFCLGIAQRIIGRYWPWLQPSNSLTELDTQDGSLTWLPTDATWPLRVAGLPTEWQLDSQRVARPLWPDFKSPSMADTSVEICSDSRRGELDPISQWEDCQRICGHI